MRNLLRHLIILSLCLSFSFPVSTRPLWAASSSPLESREKLRQLYLNLNIRNHSTLGDLSLSEAALDLTPFDRLETRTLIDELSAWHQGTLKCHDLSDDMRTIAQLKATQLELHQAHQILVEQASTLLHKERSPTPLNLLQISIVWLGLGHILNSSLPPLSPSTLPDPRASSEAGHHSSVSRVNQVLNEPFHNPEASPNPVYLNLLQVGCVISFGAFIVQQVNVCRDSQKAEHLIEQDKKTRSLIHENHEAMKAKIQELASTTGIRFLRKIIESLNHTQLPCLSESSEQEHLL